MCHGSKTNPAAEILNVLHEGVACELCVVVVMILLGTPKWHTSPLKNLMADCAVTFLTASTSGHFVNLSIATYKYSNPESTGERAQYVEPLDREGPGERDSLKGWSWLMELLRMELARFTLGY